MLNMTNIIYVYFAIVISLIMFNLFYIIYEKYSTKIIKIKYKKYKDLIIIDMKHKKINQLNIKYFIRELKYINNLRAYNLVIDELLDSKKNINEYFIKYEEIYNSLTFKYIKYDSIKKAYFAYVMGKCFINSNLTNGVIVDYMFSLIKDKSIYARENAMLFLYNNGNDDLVIDALMIISKNNIYYNHSLLTNDLLKYKGDVNNLKDKLIANYDFFNEEFKVSIINYFRYSKSNNYIDFFLKKLENKNAEKEVYLALLRFFGKYKEERALKYLIDCIYMKDKETFEYRLVSASSLKIYDDTKVKKVLIDALKDENWYVKRNAAISLSNFELNDNDYQEIKKNQEGLEMLQSVLEEKGVK